MSRIQCCCFYPITSAPVVLPTTNSLLLMSATGANQHDSQARSCPAANSTQRDQLEHQDHCRAAGQGEEHRCDCCCAVFRNFAVGFALVWGWPHSADFWVLQAVLPDHFVGARVPFYTRCLTYVSHVNVCCHSCCQALHIHGLWQCRKPELCETPVLQAACSNRHWG